MTALVSRNYAQWVAVDIAVQLLSRLLIAATTSTSAAVDFRHPACYPIRSAVSSCLGIHTSWTVDTMVSIANIILCIT